VFLAVTLIVFAILATFLVGEKDAPEGAYRTAAVRKGNIKATVCSTGKLAPLNTVEIGSQVSGNIKALYADYNSVVKKDQVVALIDPSIYAAQMNEAKAQLLRARMELLQKQKETAAARAGVQSAEAHGFVARSTLIEAELNYKRLAALANRKIVPTADLDSSLARRDNARGNMKMAEAQVRTSEAQLESALAQEKCALALIAEREAALSLAQTKLNYCTIQSPIDGVVILRNVDVGQTVAATLQSPVLFTIAEDLARMQVEVDVSEADVGQIRPGQDVEFTVDAFQDKMFKANVREVRNAATTIQNVVTYKIVADVNNDSLMLRPGMTANVTIVVATVRDALIVPNSALRFKPPGKIREEKAQKRPPIQDRPFYKKTVEELGLDPQQSRELLRIIEAAGGKLKAAYALPEETRDVEQAWRAFFIQVFTNLYKILREDQYEKFTAYRSRLRDVRKKQMSHKGRQARIYVPGEEEPVAKRIMAGISDDNVTQVIEGDLKEGDKVIVGLVLASEGTPKRSDNIFSRMLRGGR
jgi:HlyD family secretion protein